MNLKRLHIVAFSLLSLAFLCSYSPFKSNKSVLRNSVPQCLTDEIFLEADPITGQADIVFTDYVQAGNSGLIFFNFGFDDGDNPLMNEMTLDCGTSFTAFITFEDPAGPPLTCTYDVIVECADSDAISGVCVIGDASVNIPNKIKSYGGQTYILAHEEIGNENYASFTKLDVNGDLLWTIKSDVQSQCFDFIVTEGDKILAVGREEPVIINNVWQNNKSIIWEIDEDGINNQYHYYENPGRELFRGIAEHSNPVNSSFPIYINGYKNNSNPPSATDEMFLLNLDADLNINWANEYELESDDQWSDGMTELSDGSVILGGNIGGNSGNSGVVAKISGDGNTIDFIETTEDYRFRDFVELSNGAIIGLVSSSTGYTIAYLNSFLEIIYAEEFSLEQVGSLDEMAVTSSDKIIVTGESVFGDAIIGILEAGESLTSLAWYTYPESELSTVSPRVHAEGEYIVMCDGRSINGENFGARDIFYSRFHIDSIPECYEHIDIVFSQDILAAIDRTPSVIGFSLSAESSFGIMDMGDYNIQKVNACNEEDCSVDILACLTDFDSLTSEVIVSSFDLASNLQYTWIINGEVLSTDPSLEFTFSDFTLDYIVCLELTDGECVAMDCDTLSGLEHIGTFSFIDCYEDISIIGCEEVLNLAAPTANWVFNDTIDFACFVEFEPYVSECERSDGLSLLDPFPNGLTAVSCVFTAPNGYQEVCEFMVEIIDNEPPVCNIDTFHFYLNDIGEASINTQIILDNAIDNCGEVFLVDGPVEIGLNCSFIDGVGGASVPIQDEYGNETSCGITFNVLDTIPPVCEVADLVFPAEAGMDSVMVNFNNIFLDDNCDIEFFSLSIPDGSMVACGTDTVVILDVLDIGGNLETCEFSLIIDPCFDYEGVVCGTVFEDANCNGTQDPEESEFSNIQIYLLSQFGQDTIASDFTDASGNYKFESIAVGDYRVKTEIADYNVSFPPSDQYLFTVDSFDLFENFDFGLSYDGPNNTLPIEELCYRPGDTVLLEWLYNPCITSGFAHITSSVCGNNMHSIIFNGEDNDGSYNLVIPDDASNQIVEYGIITQNGQYFFNCIEINDLEIDFDFELIGCREYAFTANNDVFASYSWSYGDGEFESNDGAGEHTYTVNFTYQVCLTVETELMCAETICKDVIVDVECDDCNVTYEYIELECYELEFVVNEENYEFTTEFEWRVDDVLVSQEREPSIDLEPGVFEVCFSATDVICSDQFCRTITLDTIYPELLNCPNEIVTLSVNESCDPVIYTPEIEEGFYCHPGNDNTPDIVYTRSDGLSINEGFDLGTTTVTASFTDLYGASTSCAFEIEVIDDTDPFCVLQEITLSVDDSGELSVEGSILNDGSFDNCTSVSIESGIFNYDCDNLGFQVASFELTDDFGNESLCIGEIEVIDAIAPTYVENPITLSLDVNGEATTGLDVLASLSFDNCSDISYADIIHTYSCSDLGNPDLEFSIFDESGNETVCEASITIVDEIDPICEVSDIVITATEENGAMVSFEYTVSDNCGEPEVEFSMPDNSFYECGEYDIILTARDVSGNSSECAFRLEVKDCDACCLSESSFIDASSIEPQLESEFINDQCLFTLNPPDLNECQYLTGVDWGDGTRSEFMLSSTNQLEHIFTYADSFTICVEYTEFNAATTCFTNQICEDIILLSDCTFTRSGSSNQTIDMKVYPNPSAQDIFIELRGINFPIKNLQVFSFSSAQLVMEQKGINSFNHIIDIANFQEGIYLLQVETTNGIILYAKLMKI